MIFFILQGTFSFKILLLNLLNNILSFHIKSLLHTANLLCMSSLCSTLSSTYMSTLWPVLFLFNFDSNFFSMLKVRIINVFLLKLMHLSSSMSLLQFSFENLLFLFQNSTNFLLHLLKFTFGCLPS